MNDLKGVNSNKWPSVSRCYINITKNFQPKKHHLKKQEVIRKYKRLIKEWSDMADYANNIGSRVHFILEEKE
jgi:hypothetical protein